MKKLIVLGVVLLMFAATPALADDLFPPSYRGAQLSYQAEWDTFGHFNDPQGFFPDTESFVGDGNHQLYGAFATHLDLSPSVPVNPTSWAVVPSGPDSGLTDPGTIGGNTFVANTINWVDWRELKHVRVQVAYTDFGAGPPTITGMIGISEAFPNGSLPQGALDLVTPGNFVGGFSQPGYFYEHWIIVPNPDWEAIEFFLPQGTIVDQIVIDTISVPEPAGLGLVGLALLAVRKKQR